MPYEVEAIVHCEEIPQQGMQLRLESLSPTFTSANRNVTDNLAGTLQSPELKSASAMNNSGQKRGKKPGAALRKDVGRNFQSISIRILALWLVTVMLSGSGSAYSVLTHEEIVDLLWADQIKPLILKRYPGISEEQIKEAHAYAYGGAVIQDLGYYPFGSVEFSNLVHYVRTGDFVRELLAQSNDANEYAFALGALSHYAADIAGHPAVNQAVAIEYPKLRAKYGKSVRYAQDKTAHLKTEFGFDTVQVAQNRYASPQYHDFIGFQVSKSLLERVFPVVYGLELKDVLPREDLTVG